MKIKGKHKSKNGNLEPTIKILTYTSNNPQLKNCPLKGYEFKKIPASPELDTELVYKPYNKSFMIVAAAVVTIAMLIGVTIGWLLSGSTQSEKKTKTEQPAESKVEITDLKNLDDAKKYLNEKKEWNKASLESNKELKDLWTALNEYNFDSVKTIYTRHQLNELENCKSLIDEIDKLHIDESQMNKPFEESFHKNPNQNSVININQYKTKIRRLGQNKYLNETAEWKKQHMKELGIDKIWTNLNEFKLLDKKDFSGFENTSKLKEILKAIEECKDQDKLQEEFENTKTYNQLPNDHKITIAKYIEHITDLVKKINEPSN